MFIVCGDRDVFTARSDTTSPFEGPRVTAPHSSLSFRADSVTCGFCILPKAQGKLDDNNDFRRVHASNNLFIKKFWLLTHLWPKVLHLLR